MQLERNGAMSGLSKGSSALQQLLDLHAIDVQVRDAENERKRYEAQLQVVTESVAGLEAGLERVSNELERARLDARAAERAVDDKRAALDRLRGRVNLVQNQKQYSAASLEFDLVKQDVRKLEDRALERLLVVEELESRQSGVQAELDVARSEVGPLAEEVESRRKKLDEELAILRDRRDNLAVRIDETTLILYNRIRSGRSAIALAPLTGEGVCGHCFTAVTVQQEMQIREMSTLVCCEGCGVILHPQDVKG